MRLLQFGTSRDLDFAGVVPVGFKIILQSSRIFCDTLLVTIHQDPNSYYKSIKCNLHNFTDLSLLANRSHGDALIKCYMV